MILTGSRGGVIGLGLAVLVYFYYKEQRLRKRFKSIVVGLFMVLALTLLVLSNDILYNRFFPTDDSSFLDDRYLIWEAVHTIISDNLLFGVGVFKYEIEITRLMGEYRATHNEYLTIWVYAGLLGLLFFIFFLFQVLKSALKSAKKHKNPLFISLFVLLLFSLFKGGGLLLSILIWFLFVFILYSNEILTHESNLEEG
jgi:O-antigen ligase